MAIPDGSLAIVNQTGAALHVYNFDFGSSKLASHTTIASGKTQNLAMTPNAAQMRVYFSNEKLSDSLGASPPSPPDIFNPSVDGDKPFSFVEYFYQQSSSVYTFDISFLDTLSYPITVAFDNVENKGLEWGIKDLRSVVVQLKAQPESFWSDLAWDDGSGILRIVGPNKAMIAPPTAPQSILDFQTSFPQNGTTLSPDNWDAWQNSTTQPNSTGWVKAMHAASLGQQSFNPGSGAAAADKYGFFLFPRDNAQGEFTFISESVHCTVTVYPIAKPSVTGRPLSDFGKASESV